MRRIDGSSMVRKQVVDADIGKGDQVLVNTLAKQKAAELLADADDYF